MRKAEFAFLLAILPYPTPAPADWLLVSEDDFSKIYMDPASKKKLPGGEIRLDALTDYNPQAAEAKSFGLSEKGLSEVVKLSLDCSKQRYKSAGGSWFEGHMGDGAVRSAYPAQQSWSAVPGYYAKLFSKLCSDN